MSPGQNHLQGDDAIKFLLPAFIHDAHAAAPQLGQNLVALDVRSRGGRGRSADEPPLGAAPWLAPSDGSIVGPSESSTGGISTVASERFCCIRRRNRLGIAG